MCRWITLLSTRPVSLSDIILSPTNSLIQLSKDASYHPEFSEMNNHVTNGDGFGVGWYHCNDCIINNSNSNSNTKNSSVSNGEQEQKQTNQRRRYAAVFKDTQPAWNDQNLRELCQAVQSDCMIAHVRAASVFAGICQQNCHPFKSGPNGRLLFCHNGRIGNFDQVRRQFHNLLSDEAYMHLKGTTDSETLFALLCTYLSQDGQSSSISPYQQTEPFGHERLTTAVKKVLKTIEHILSNNQPLIPDSNFSTLNFCITDGETVVVTRFCDKSPNVPPPSLYFAFGDAYKLHDELTDEQQNQQSVPPVLRHQTSSMNTNSGPDDESNHWEKKSDSSLSEYDEKHIDVDTYESKPGTIYADIDLNHASFIVASNPLTKTHTWHPMPKNSIMWYQRGSLPELRILRASHHSKKTRTVSYVLSSSWCQADIQQHGNNP